LKLHGKVVVWPASLDSSKTRRQGRKLVKGQAVQAPRLDELIEASKRLSLEVESTPHKARPEIWWEKSGYLIFPRPENKNELLRSLASEVRKIRAAKSTPDKERK